PDPETVLPPDTDTGSPPASHKTDLPARFPLPASNGPPVPDLPAPWPPTAAPAADSGCPTDEEAPAQSLPRTAPAPKLLPASLSLLSACSQRFLPPGEPLRPGTALGLPPERPLFSFQSYS